MPGQRAAMSDNKHNPSPHRFFRIIKLPTFSRHRIDSQWFTGIFFYCNSYKGALPPARNLGKNEPSQLAVAQRPVSCHEPVASDCQTLMTFGHLRQ